jgi:plasmid stabilization system protein ParE
MAERKIRWTRRALQGKMAIMEYWFRELGTVDYSLKLEALFTSTLETLANLPKMGPLFDEKRNIRYVVVRDYKIYYTFNDKQIEFLQSGIQEETTKHLPFK